MGNHRVQPVTIINRQERPNLGAGGRPISVALVNMPWVTIDGPSIQVGLLTSLARDAGHSAQGIYLNVELAAEIGPEAYERILSLPADRQHYFQEWLFSAAAFGYSETAENAYCRECDALPRILEHLGLSEAEIRGLHRDFYPALIDRWARDWPWGQFDVVGFTSTFEQNVPALALARAIKRESPRCATRRRCHLARKVQPLLHRVRLPNPRRSAPSGFGLCVPGTRAPADGYRVLLRLRR
jgi:hypothetical protein